jgi:hypothetical protein
MTGSLIICLTIAYLVIALVACYEKKWDIALYFTGAIIINLALLMKGV